MPDDVSPPSAEDALSVAFATRVTAVLSTFLGRLEGSSSGETFDPQSAVQMRWRQLGGSQESAELVSSLDRNVPEVAGRIGASTLPAASVASAAIDVITMLLDDSVTAADRPARLSGLGLRLAMEMDRTA